MPADEISAKVVIEGGKQAQKDLAAIGKEAKKLDGTEIKVDTDTKAARKDIDGLFEQVDKLGKFSGKIVLKDNAKDIRREIADLVMELDRLDANDPEVQIKVDQINALEGDLDKVQAKLKEINSVPIDVDTHRATAGLDEVGKSAGSSRSVLANMVGNATQDLGALGGIAGSAGVAIGQMGEYMVDASADGDKLSTIVGNFAKVAGPIAALSAATAVFSTVLGGIKAQDAFEAEKVEEFTAALKEGQSVLETIKQDILETGKIAFETGALGGGGFLGLGSATKDILPTLNDLHVGYNQWQKDLVEGQPAVDRYRQKALDLASTNAELALKYNATADALQTYVDTSDSAGGSQAELNEFMGGAVKVAEAAAAAWIKAHKPMEDMPKTWEAVANGAERMRQGLQPTANQFQAAAVIAEQYGISVEGAFDRADAANEEHNAAFKAGLDDTATALEQWAKDSEQSFVDAVKAAEEFALKLVDAQVAIDDLASSFGQMGVRGDALSSIFDLKDAPLKLGGEVRDIAIAIGGLSEAAKGVKVGDILAGNIKADKFLDAIDAVRPDIQNKITEAFSTGGPDAAIKMANSYIGQVTKELGGRLTRAQVAKLLGLDNIEATVNLAIDQASLANAQKELDILTGITGENTYTASIKLALAQGDISPQAAQLLINKALKDAGVKVPGSLDIQGTPAAMAEAEKFARENPVPIASEMNTPENIAAMASTVQILLARFGVTLPSAMGMPTGVNTTLNTTQSYLNQHPLRVGLTVNGITRLPGGRFRAANGAIMLDAGGTAGSGGGIAGERRPEIVNNRYLITQPTVVPPGTRVTSGARTARILRTRGTQGLRRYDAGGTVAAGPSTVNVNFNGVGAIGNRYDLMRVVRQATRDQQRLLGTRT